MTSRPGESGEVAVIQTKVTYGPGLMCLQDLFWSWGMLVVLSNSKAYGDLFQTSIKFVI